MSDMKIAIMGAAGRMGRTLIDAVHRAEGCCVAGATEPMGSEFIGQDAGTLAGIGHIDVPIVSDPLELFTKIDGLIDFTVPAATTEFAALAAQARIVHVIGTTGCSSEDEAKLTAAGRHATIIKAGNMSPGSTFLPPSPVRSLLPLARIST